MISAPQKNQNAVVAVFNEHSGVEKAVKELQEGGFDITKLSIIARDYHTEDNVVGFCNTGARIRYWGKFGAFWGGVGGLLVGSTFLFIPGVGPVVEAGSVVTWIVEGAILVGGLSTLGAALYSISMRKDSVVKYETSMKAGEFVLIATDQVEKARSVLQTSGPEQINVHLRN